MLYATDVVGLSGDRRNEPVNIYKYEDWTIAEYADGSKVFSLPASVCSDIIPRTISADIAVSSRPDSEIIKHLDGYIEYCKQQGGTVYFVGDDTLKDFKSLAHKGHSPVSQGPK